MSERPKRTLRLVAEGFLDPSSRQSRPPIPSPAGPTTVGTPMSVGTPQNDPGPSNIDTCTGICTGLVEPEAESGDIDEQPDPTPHLSAERGIKHSAWAGLKALKGVVSKGAEVFGPLKSAVDDASRLIELFEGNAQAYRDYKQISDDLDALFNTLSACIRDPMPPAMRSSILDFARGIKHEMKLFEQKGQRNTISRHTQALEDAEEVSKCYRRIQTLVERLTLNANVSMWKTLDELATNDRLRMLPNSPAAQYRSAESDSLGRVPCTPDTRTQVLDQLRSWARDETSEKIYWLNGMAGTGKTTIAYSFCDYLKDVAKLGASFFCSRQHPACRDINRIIPSISHQLSLFSLPFRHALSRVLERDQEAHNRPLGEQFNQLVLGPLREIERTFPTDVVIVLDALDECDDKDGVSRILGVLLTTVSGFSVKFFVTGRPDPEIVDQMRNQEIGVHSELRLHELDHAVVQQDITTYLRAGLERAKLSEADLRRLAERSGALFIYAATAARYISSGGFSRSAKRLKLVLDASSAAPSSSDRDVDALYTAILQAAFDTRALDDSDKEEMMTILCTIICAEEPLSVDTIGALLGLDPSSSVQPALQSLLSVLNISETSGLVTTLHESFPDYILNRRRSDRFHCDARQHDTRLAHLCFDLIKVPNPPFNICKLESSYLFDKDVPDIDKRVDEAISGALHYACRYWGAHLKRANTDEDLVAEVYKFLSERLLLWVEILNLKKQMHDGAGMLHKIQEWCQDGTKCSDELRLLAQDAYRFVVVISSSPITRSTPHIYMSGLPFWPESRPVTRLYMRRLGGLVRATGAAMAKQEHTPVTIYTGGDQILCAVYSPDGGRVASASESGTVYIWDAYTGQTIGQPLKGHTSAAICVSFSPDSAYLASASSDKTIRIWNVHTGQTIGRALNGHTGAVASVAYSPNGAYIVSGSWDRTLRIWDARTGLTRGHPLEGHTGCVYSVAFSPNGARVVSGSEDFSIRIWDPHTGQIMGQPLQGHTGAVYSVAYSPSGSHIISGSFDRSIRIWDARTYQAVGQPLTGHTKPIWSVGFSPDGARIISGSGDHSIRIWDAHTRQMVGHRLAGHAGEINSVAYSPDGMHLLSASDDTTIRIWDSHTGVTVDQPLAGHFARVSAVVWSPDGARIVSGSFDGIILIWDAHSHKPLGLPFMGHSEGIELVSYSPDGAHVTSCSANEIRVWDSCTGKLVGQVLKAHTRRFMSLAYSPDGSSFISVSSNGATRVWAAQTCLEVGQPFKGHDDDAYSIACSPGGTHIAVGFMDSVIHIWDPRTGQLVGQPLIGHTSGVCSVAYSSDGAWIVSGSLDKTIRIWDAHACQMRGEPLVGHTEAVISVACSPDFAYIVSGSRDSTIRIWDAHTCQMVGQPLQGHSMEVYSVAYSPDGRRIVSGSGDQTVRIWDAHIARNQAHLENETDVDLGPVTHAQPSEYLTPNHRGPPPPTPRLPAPRSPHASSSLAPCVGSCPYVDHTRSPVLDSWKIDEDGWVVTDGSKLLAWVPLVLRSFLPCFPNTAVLSRHGELRLDFSRANLGEAWQQCYVHSELTGPADNYVDKAAFL